MIIPGKGHSAENVISLLQCLVETMVEPEHAGERFCGTNKCDRCNYDVWKEELEAPFKERR